MPMPMPFSTTEPMDIIPAYYYGHYPYIFGRKRRDADAGAAPDADALLYYRTYGYYPSYYYGHYPLLGR